MINIYDHSFFTEKILMPVGRFAGKIPALIGKDVEKYKDTYSSYHLTATEVVNREKLSPSQKLTLSKDPKYKDGDLHLITMISPAKKQGEQDILRQFFVNKELIEKIKEGNLYNIETTGQFWGNIRPRIQEVEKIGTAPTEPQKPQKPQKPNSRARWWFMSNLEK